MRNKFLFAITIATALFTSCGEDGTADIVINNFGDGDSTGTDNSIEIKGNYSSDLTLDATKSYTITGATIFESGTTLTIPAGITVKASATGADVYLAIAQGAKIIAEGTSTAPIIFTSASTTPNAGDWGGLILLGKAPVNSVTGATTATSEIANLPYGGTVADDDSGILRYVRVEYSGGKADGQSENNGFSFYGVGNKTVVEYIQMFECKDDGGDNGGNTTLPVLSIEDAEFFEGSYSRKRVFKIKKKEALSAPKLRPAVVK